jgi:hypothetical protein
LSNFYFKFTTAKLIVILAIVTQKLWLINWYIDMNFVICNFTLSYTNIINFLKIFGITRLKMYQRSYKNEVENEN